VDAVTGVAAPKVGDGRSGSLAYDASQVDRRVVRTRAALRRALIDLVEERGLDGFTTSHLCERAGLNRGTFYNHCKDKDDLIAQFENKILAEVEGFQADMADLSLPVIALQIARRKPLAFLVDLFDYLRSEGDFLHAVLGPGGDPAFALHLRETVCDNLVRTTLHEKYRESPTPFVGYYVAFFANAYLGIIARWIETGMHESSQEMALIAQRLLFIKPGEAIEL
jgi:AcrR family transcriptional regulator